MDMVIDFTDGVKVNAHFGPFTIAPDQPPQGGG
jgi:putative redox protein